MITTTPKLCDTCGPQASVPPGDLQVQLDRPQVVDIHGERLGEWAEQVEHFARHAAHHHVIGQALQLRHLDNQNEDEKRQSTVLSVLHSTRACME